MSVDGDLITLEGQEEMCSFVRLIITMRRLTQSKQDPTIVVWEYCIRYVFFC